MKQKIKMPKTKRKISNRVTMLLPSIGLSLFVCLGLAIFILPPPVFSSTKAKSIKEKSAELVQKQDALILDKTNSYYNKGLYLKAVDEINIAIENHQETNDIPDNIQLMAEASYYAWINSAFKNNRTPKLSDYNKFIMYLTLHPEVMSPRIDNLIEEIYQNEKNYLESLRITNIEKDDKVKLEKIRATVVKIDSAKRDLAAVVAHETSVKEVKRAIQIEKDYARAQRIKYLMISLYILIFAAIVVLIVIIYRNHKRTLEAQKQFETTMKVVAILQRDTENGESPYQPLKSKTDDENENTAVKLRRRVGLSDFESEKLAVAYFDSETAKKDFLVLQNECIELGDKIDKATGRARNSKKVSELVFKLCKTAGVDDELALIYYCAAMVYDAGFLSISRNILQGEHLTIKERYEVRSHVQKANEYFGFIPESVRRIFLDAAEFHHENMDGKGYLAGLSNTKIPLIARFIRVAESYISLVNSRSYKKIMDANSALTELSKKSGIYDPKILALLEKVI